MDGGERAGGGVARNVTTPATSAAAAGATPRTRGDAERESGVCGSDGVEERADRCCVVEETRLGKEDSEQRRQQPQKEPMVPPLHPEPPTTLGSNSRKLATPVGHWSANALIFKMVTSSEAGYSMLWRMSTSSSRSSSNSKMGTCSSDCS